MAKILLVEDDNNLREIFEMRLVAEGYQTVTAGNGEEGLTVALKEKPDLIVADVMMPKLSGFDMLESLRATPETKDTKVILMTALGQAEDQERGKSLGVVKYLVKSQATLEDFARVIKEVLPPDGATSSKAVDDQTGSIQNSNQLESENKMPDDQTPTMPTNDTGAPADGAMPGNGSPVAGGSGSTTPAMPADSGQMTTAQEQSSVSDQINSFASSTPTDTTPSAPAADEPAAPQPSSTFAPTAPPADATTTPYDQPATTTDAAGASDNSMGSAGSPTSDNMPPSEPTPGAMPGSATPPASGSDPNSQTV